MRAKKNPHQGGPNSHSSHHSTKPAKPRLLVPTAEQKRSLDAYARGIVGCILCGEWFRRDEERWVLAYQVDPRNNPDAFYYCCIHPICRERMTQSDLITLEAKAKLEFTEYLQSLRTVGGAQ